MSAMEYVIICFSGAMFLCFMVLGMVCWKLVSCLPDMTGEAIRCRERERQDLFDLLERILEKEEAEPGRLSETVHRHAQERIETNRVDGNMETEAQKSRVPPVSSNSNPTEFLSDREKENISSFR